VRYESSSSSSSAQKKITKTGIGQQACQCNAKHTSFDDVYL